MSTRYIIPVAIGVGCLALGLLLGALLLGGSGAELDEALRRAAQLKIDLSSRDMRNAELLQQVDRQEEQIAPLTQLRDSLMGEGDALRRQCMWKKGCTVARQAIPERAVFGAQSLANIGSFDPRLQVAWRDG